MGRIWGFFPKILHSLVTPEICCMPIQNLRAYMDIGDKCKPPGEYWTKGFLDDLLTAELAALFF